MILIHFADEIEPAALALVGHILRRTEVDDGVAGGAEGGALISRGHEAVAPVGSAADGAAAGISEDDKGGKVLIFGAEAVGKPTAHGGVAGLDEAGVHLIERGAVVVGGTVHRAYEGDLVDLLGDVGEERRNVHAGLAVLLELP